jgi:type IV secretion system protein VirD4
MLPFPSRRGLSPVCRRRCQATLSPYHPPARGSGQTAFGACVSALRDWFTASDNTFTSIRQSVTAKINLWLNPYVDAATAESDFDLRSFREERISLYLGVSLTILIASPRSTTSCFSSSSTSTCASFLWRSAPGPLLLLLDEFPRLGRASVIANGFSYVAGYGIRLLPVIQNGAQLENVYGPRSPPKSRPTAASRW